MAHPLDHGFYFRVVFLLPGGGYAAAESLDGGLDLLGTALAADPRAFGGRFIFARG
ncbi:MAG: hypothetical protein V1918_00110 [Planctomycetota bacterium]